jgi:hypothetical protein
MEKVKAIAICRAALLQCDNVPSVMLTDDYIGRRYDAMIALYDQDGFRHMPAIIIQHIEADFRCISSF